MATSHASPRERRREREQELRRADVIGAASRIFAEKGFHDAQIGEIASGDGEHRKLSTLAGTLTLPPVTLRVSRFTASSAEIFAHALKAHLPGTRVVGEATRGKCLVQQRFGLADGSELVLSTGQFLMEGRPCEGRPLQAD